MSSTFTSILVISWNVTEHMSFQTFICQISALQIVIALCLYYFLLKKESQQVLFQISAIPSFKEKCIAEIL